MSVTPARRGLLNSAATFMGIGLGTRPPAAAAKEPKEPKVDDDADMKKKAEEDAKKAKKEKGRRARNRKAGRDPDDDGDDGDYEGDGEGDDENDDDETEAARSEREDAEDEDDMRKGSANQAASLRQQARCAAIFASPHAVGRLDTAARLAFTTNLPRHQAIGVLASTPKSGAGGLAARMENAPKPNVGPGAAPPTPEARARAGMEQAFFKHAVTDAKPPKAAS